MATNEVKKKVGAQFSFADHAGDFSPVAKTTLELGTQTDVQISLASVADGAGRESAKFNFGATFGAKFSCDATFEFAATPVTGEVVEVWIAPSVNSTAANGNIMSIDGVDAAAPSGIGTLAELVDACQFVGNFICTNDATGSIQTAFVGTFTPDHQYGILVLKNESGAAFHSDDVECHIVFTELLDDIQAPS